MFGGLYSRGLYSGFCGILSTKTFRWFLKEWRIERRTVKQFDRRVISEQGGGKRLPNYHLVGENCVLVGENLFDLPDSVGENICLLKIYVG